MKPDTSIRNICIAGIKRKTIVPYNFPLTSFFEKELWDEVDNKIVRLLNLTTGELPIAIVFIDNDNFTIVTTRQIITCQSGITRSAKPINIISWTWNDFKGYTNGPFTRGRLTFSDNSIFEVFIETGRASMVMIYAIRTLSGQYHNIP